jgi:hypothetical protein
MRMFSPNSAMQGRENGFTLVEMLAAMVTVLAKQQKQKKLLVRRMWRRLL